MTVPSEASSGGSSSSWLFKNKEHGKASAAASLVCNRSYFVIWLDSYSCQINKKCEPHNYSVFMHCRE